MNAYAEYLTKMTVKSLKEIADRMGVVYNSRTRKHDLITSIYAEVENAWNEAILVDLDMQDEIKAIQEEQIMQWWDDHGLRGRQFISAEDVLAARDADHVEALMMNAPVKKAPKSYTERMLNRIQGYYHQNGCARLTPRQDRRQAKKYKRQHGNLLSQLNA